MDFFFSFWLRKYFNGFLSGCIVFLIVLMLFVVEEYSFFQQSDSNILFLIGIGCYVLVNEKERISEF